MGKHKFKVNGAQRVLNQRRWHHNDGSYTYKLFFLKKSETKAVPSTLKSVFLSDQTKSI